jgi:ribonuclease VapC
MVIDTSAIVAITASEPEAVNFQDKIIRDPVRLISAVTWLKAAIVLEARFGEAAAGEFDLWLHTAGFERVAADAEQTDVARWAWQRFGKGRHPAGLNFGDCFSYALAMTRGEPLLFKGNDFALTDVVPA